MSTELEAAAKAFHRAEAALEKRREELASAIVKAAREHVRPTDIVRITGYTREHVRRILREAGVQPSRPAPPERTSGTEATIEEEK